MKLELKHLAPYLPYRLKVSLIHTLHGHTGIGSVEHVVQAVNEGKSQFKPILRPLSDLTKEIEHNGEKFVPTKALSMWDLQGITVLDIPHIPVNLYELLLKWHFDVFGLIEKGLAIDINTLKE